MKETLKEKIRAHKPICGTHVQLAEPAICQIYAQLGYDYIWLDMEHSYMSLETAINCLNAAKAHDTPVIVRVPKDDLTFTKKVLEMGPEGILFPMVNSAEEANRVIGHTLYPPYGNRGCGPMRAVGYGAAPLVSYVKYAHLDMCRFIQLETTTAIEDLERIVLNPYIDGYVFGPVDLSGSVGDILNVTSGQTMEWMKKAISILKAHHKYIGISYGDYSVEAIRRWHDMGIDMISVGSDFGYLYECGIRALDNIKKAHTGE